MSATDVRSISLTITAATVTLPTARMLVNATSANGLLDAISDVAPSGVSGSLAGAMIGWNSGSVISANGTHGRGYFIGGGHNNYAGNEVYEFDIGSRTWSRIWGPSTGLTGPGNVDPFDAYDQYPDGAPGAPHTYDHFVAIPPTTGHAEGQLVLAGRAYAGWDGGSSTGYAAIFDVATRTWSRSTNVANIGPAVVSATYDPDRHGVWSFGSAGATGQVAFLNLTDSTWATYSMTDEGSPYIGYDLVGTWVASLGLIVQRSTYASENTIRVFNPATKTRTVVATTGSGPGATDHTGLEWCAEKGRAFAYKAGSSMVWKLAPPTTSPTTNSWAWSSETFASGSVAPSFTSAGGDETGSNLRSNRWRWVPRIGCFLWHDTVTATPQLYRPA